MWNRVICDWQDNYETTKTWRNAERTELEVRQRKRELSGRNFLRRVKPDVKQRRKRSGHAELLPWWRTDLSATPFLTLSRKRSADGQWSVGRWYVTGFQKPTGAERLRRRIGNHWPALGEQQRSLPATMYISGLQLETAARIMYLIGWMDGLGDGLTDGQTNGRSDGLTDGRTDGRTDG